MARARKADKGGGSKSKGFNLLDAEDHQADDGQEDLPKDEAGRRKIKRQYEELLGILPGTAMVIRGDLLLTDTEVIEESEEVEIRAVISGGSGGRP